MWTSLVFLKRRKVIFSLVSGCLKTSSLLKNKLSEWLYSLDKITSRESRGDLKGKFHQFYAQNSTKSLTLCSQNSRFDALS